MLPIQGTRRSGAGPTMTSTKHGAAFIDARIYDKKIVIFGVHVFVNEMHASFLRSGADPVTVCDKASILYLLISYGIALHCLRSPHDQPFSPLSLVVLRSKGHGFPQCGAPENGSSGNSCGNRNSDWHAPWHSEFQNLQRLKML